MIERRYLVVAGVRLAYLEHGVPCSDAPSLLMLHGLIANAESFNALAANLPGHHIVALDMPGSGRSAHEGVAPDFDSLAQVLKLFADALGLVRPVLIGHSHGGAVSLRLAVGDPSWPRGLVLLCPAHPFSGSEEQLVRFYLSPAGWVLAKIVPKLPRWLHRAAFHRMPGRHLQLGEAQLKPYLDTLSTERTVQYVLQLLRCWESDMRVLRVDLEAQPLKTPTLLLWGERDLVVPPRSAEELVQHMTRAQLIRLKGVGHLPNDEAPQECAQIIASWIALLRDDQGFRPNSV